MYLGKQLFLCTIQLLLTSPLLLGCQAEGQSETQYFMSIPASLGSGEMAKACVTILGIEENLDLRLIMNYNGQNTSIISEDVSSPTYFQCAEFQVPNASEAVPVAVMLSAIGKKTEIRERKTVVIKPTRNNCLIQMDKPIYKPGQKVRSRIVCLNSQLKAFNEKFPVVYLQDPSRTRIAQWLQKETERGVLSLDFQLIKDAPAGSYSFRIERESGTPLSKWFTVEEYVKPRFSMKVDAPTTISVLDTFLNYTVSAMFTYGEMVKGVVTVRSCLAPSFYGRRKNCIRGGENPCSDTTGELGPDGTFSGVVKLPNTFMGSTGMSINLEATLIEEGTGIQVRESHYAWVTSQPSRISFDYGAINPHYKRGLDYPVVATLTDEQDQPIPNQDIDVELDGKLIETVTTDSQGKINYGIDTTNMVAPNMTVKLSYKNPDQCYYADWRDTDYPTTEYTAFRFYSSSGSFLQAKRASEEQSCGQDYSVEVQYIINPSGVREGANKVTIFNLVLSKSKIVHSGQQDIDLTSSMNGSFSVVFPVSADMTPNANLVIYTLLNKELIAETVDLNVEKCFKNQVSMAFEQEEGTPGSNAEVLVSGDPQSICGIRVIDYSLLLMNPYESFSADAIYNSLRTWTTGYNVAGFDVEDPAPPCDDPDKLIFFNGHYYLPKSSESERDSYQNLKESGLVFATDSQTRKPVVCDKNPPEQSKFPIQPIALESSVDSGFGGALFKANAVSGGSAGASIETFRSNFSETFMWMMVPLDEEGRASLTEKVPDSITKWQGSAFCLSDKGGFGMTKYPANFTAKLPFFMELSLPYSIIRGEILSVVGVVYNYLDACIKVQAKLEPSDAFSAELKEGTQDACVCSNGQAAYTWEVKANHLGEIAFIATAETTFIGKSCDGPKDDYQSSRKDTVVQELMIEPEGIRQVRTLSDLVFLKNTKSVLPVRITPPNFVVPDSISASISVVGDLFGLPLSGLEDLVQKPYGCGEQNLARLAPIPCVIEYLNNTGQLTDELLQKAKGFMQEGYYRQLGFLSGNAYRLFPNPGEQVNSWLTAYSFAAIEKCKNYISIDSDRQQQTLVWLENTQRLDNGCFRPQGKYFMNQDVDDDLHYTTYLAISLMESDYSLGMTLLDGAMECIKAASTKDQKIADEALMVYAFTLAKLDDYRDRLLQKLMKKAITEGGTMHWQREDMPEGRPVPFFMPIFAPAEVKMTAYILLSMTEWSGRSESDLNIIAQVALWLVRQMNSNGGFASSTDTVVALQALSAVARIMYTPNAQQTVLVRRGNAEIAKFDLNQKNRLLVQRQPLPDANGDYTIEVEGNGWCLLQTMVGYHIPVPKENSAFKLDLSTTSDNCLKGVARTFNISGTLSYLGNQNVSNMAIIQIRILSGYDADYWSLRELVDQKIISRHEKGNKGEVLLYINSVPEEPIAFTFRVFMGQRVLNVKTSSAIAYDYYDPAVNGYASYGHPCAERKI